MMLTFVFVLVSFDLFTLTENRKCLGVDGWECCNGYALDILSGNCKKCPVGYHSDDCSKKCIPPTYGEDCQYLCSSCSNYDCHFVYGCLQDVKSFTVDQQLNSTRITSYERITTRTSNSTVSDVTISYKKNSLDFTGDNNKLSDTTLAYLPSNIDLFKNNLVVHVIISLIGVFVFFFAIFVVTYIYFKCFRKTTNTSALKETEWQAQYKTLSFDAVEPQLIPLHPEQQGRVNTDFTYLTPVFSGNESRESRRTGENDRRKENEVIIPETHLQVQRVSSQETISRQNEPSIGHDDVQEHVYIEITEEKTESSKLNADPENENQKATCTNAIKEEL